MIGDDAVHHDIVEYGSDQGPHHLHGKSHTWGQVAILSEFEIGRKEGSLRDSIIALTSPVSVLGKGEDNGM